MESAQTRPRAVVDRAGSVRPVVEIVDDGGHEVVLVHDSRGRILRIEATSLEQEGAVWSLPCGWAELEAANAPAAGPVPERVQEPNREAAVRIPVVEEVAEVSTRPVERGRVRVHRTVHEEVERVDVPLVSETARIRRVPVDRYVEEPPQVREEGDEIVVPVVEEVLVVEKRLRLREEIRIRRERRTEQATRRVPLRRTEVEVERVPLDDEEGDADER